jgi:uncharacterized protein
MQQKPVAAQQRFELLDALRGFAVFGIFIVNMVASSLGGFTGDDMKLWPMASADHVWSIVLDTTIEGKFYSIFSLLFGIGFGLQLQRHADKGLNGLPLFKKRLWGLLLIGFLHMLLLWLGDILFLYAWLGFVLILFKNKSNKYLLQAAVICLAIPVLLYPLRFLNKDITLGAPFYLSMVGVGKQIGLDVMNMNPAAMMAEPGWGKYFTTNFITFFFRQADLFDQVRPFKVLAMFLLGLWVSRKRWHENVLPFLDAFKKYAFPLLVFSLLINLGMAFISWSTYYNGDAMGWLKSLLYFLGVTPLSICYVYYFSKAYTSQKWQWLHAFTYVGRMALTNYILQSVLYVIIFRGPFFALSGKIGSVICLVPVLLFFPLQMMFSKWWLQRFQFGPLEWAWRSMTYGKWQPLKRYKENEAE